MLLNHIEGKTSAEEFFHNRVGDLDEEIVVHLKFAVAVCEVLHQQQGMEEGVVARARLQHDLVAVAALSGIAAECRREAAGTHHHPGRSREESDILELDERRTEVFVRTGSAYGRRDVGAVPEPAAGVHLATEHSRQVRGRCYCPWHQVFADVGTSRGDDVEREAGIDLLVIESAEFAQSKSVSVSDFRYPETGIHHWNRALDQASGRIDVVYDVDSRSLETACTGAEKTHHVPRVVEISCAHVLDFHYNGIERVKLFGIETDMAGIRSKFSFARGEYLGEIASLLEDVVEIASLCRIPAVLCAEAADLAVNQTAV